MASETKRLIYSFVYRKKNVLVECSSSMGNFRSVAQMCLETLPQNNNRFSLSQQGYTLNYLLEDGFVFMVLCDKSFPKEEAFVYLENVKIVFMKEYKKANTKEKKAILQTNFKTTLEKLMEDAEIMGEKAIQDALADKEEAASGPTKAVEGSTSQTEKQKKQWKELEMKVEKAKDFKERSKEIRQKLWWDRCAALLISIVFITIAIVIWVSLCHGFKCNIDWHSFKF